MRSAIILGLASFAVLSAVTIEVSQASTDTSAAGQPAAEQAIPDIKALSKDITEQGNRLLEDAQSALKRADDLEPKLQESQKNFDLELAKKNVNEMVATLRTARDRLSPDKTYRKALAKAEFTIRDLSSLAEASADPTIRAMKSYYEQVASEIVELQRGSEELRNQLTVEIDRFERMLDRIAFTRTVAGIEEFMQQARSYLEIMRNIGARARGFGNSVENFGQSPPSQ